MSPEDVRARLFALADEGYGNFVAGLIPTMERERIIGVRMPALRAFGGELAKDLGAGLFLQALPHIYLEEMGLHALLIAREKDIGRALALTEALLPFIDNWATCDSLHPKVFKKHPDRVLARVLHWFESPLPYTQRFAMGTLMSDYLGEYFEPWMLDLPVGLQSGEYYVNMMRAWYLSMALVRQWEAALPVLAERRLDKWTHHKTIQKAVESHQLPDERKLLLKSLRYR